MSQTDFSFEFLGELAQPDENLRIEAERRLRELAEGHTDIIGASVAIEELTGAETPHRYQARVVVYMRPSDIAAVEKGPNAMTALEQSLNVVERQVREYREKLRERWKQP
jgi:ribosome-associated translation inhibitor RaiA